MTRIVGDQSQSERLILLSFEVSIGGFSHQKWQMITSRVFCSPGGKGVALRVLDVHDVEASRMSFPRGDDTDSTQVVATGHHAQVARLELDEV